MALVFQCHSCKYPIVGSGEITRFKWKNKSKMVKVVVCENCWNRAKSLKVKK